MELRHFRYFKVVAELQHFHNAAKVLCITQPALSNQIKQFERELDAPLFERVGRGVKLTECGEAVQASIHRVLNEVENMRSTVDDLKSGTAGTLKIGVLQSINALYLRKIVTDFDRHYPNISLCIEELANDQIEEKIIQGEIDLGIGFILKNRSKNVRTEALFSEKWKLVVSLQHKSLIKDILSGKEHTLKAVLLPEYFQTRKVIDAFFEASNIRLGRITEINSISSILDLVENGHSYTILPEAFSAFGKNHALHSHYINELPAREVGILESKDRMQKSSVSKFRELMLKEFQS